MNEVLMNEEVVGGMTPVLNNSVNETESVKETVEELNMVAYEEDLPDVSKNAKKEPMAVITEGMAVTGDVSTVGPLEVYGSINGDINSNNLVKVLGEVRGNIEAHTVYVDEAVVVGDIKFVESTEISKESIVVGNISGDKSIAIAGSVKGNIDVHEDLYLLTGAVVVGDIKCKSIKVEPGVSIKGTVDQCYLDVDVEALFSNY